MKSSVWEYRYINFNFFFQLFSQPASNIMKLISLMRLIEICQSFGLETQKICKSGDSSILVLNHRCLVTALECVVSKYSNLLTSLIYFLSRATIVQFALIVKRPKTTVGSCAKRSTNLTSTNLATAETFLTRHRKCLGRLELAGPFISRQLKNKANKFKFIKDDEKEKRRLDFIWDYAEDFFQFL